MSDRSETKSLEAMAESYSLKELAQDLALSIVNLIPIAGPAAAGIIGSLITKKALQNLSIFVLNLQNQVEELRNRNSDLVEKLLENEKFQSQLVVFANIARFESNEVKQEYLRNYLMNSCILPDVKDDLEMIFNQLIEKLTPSHLQLLDLLNDPKSFYAKREIEWKELMMGSKAGLILECFPSWSPEFTKLIASDLATSNLISTDSLNVTTTGSGVGESITTQIGKLFVTRIESPAV